MMELTTNEITFVVMCLVIVSFGLYVAYLSRKEDNEETRQSAA